MQPTFSEFSYGYALTEELVRGALHPLSGYPMFPSLRKEGQPEGGYDVKLPLVGAPLYLQFKRSDFMVRAYAKYWEYFGAPFFRMYIMPTRYSMQHELLIHLDLSGKAVYYVAPEFYTSDDLTEHYMNKAVLWHSALFMPSDIGHLPDDEKHCVAFDRGPTAYSCSKEPVQIKKLAGKSFAKSYRSTYQARRRRVDDVFFDHLIDRMIEVLENRRITIAHLKKTRSMRKEIQTLEEKALFAGFVTRAYFDTELFVIGGPAEF